MGKNSKEELIEEYKELYLRGKNSEQFIDFDFLVLTYKVFLCLFFDKNSSFYGDVSFFTLVVDGFNYFYEVIYGNEEADLCDVTFSLKRHDAELRAKIVTPDKINDSDFIFCYSLKFATVFQEMGMVEKFYDVLQRMFFNSYVIENIEKERGKNGVENRKCFN